MHPILKNTNSRYIIFQNVYSFSVILLKIFCQATSETEKYKLEKYMPFISSQFLTINIAKSQKQMLHYFDRWNNYNTTKKFKEVGHVFTTRR